MNFMLLVVPQNAQAYLEEKFLDDPANEEEKNKIARLLDNARANTVIPEIAAESEFFEVDRKQMKLIDISKRCAIQALSEEYPLNEGEEIQDDFFSYLKAPFGELPAATAVLKRKTNMAEILYFFDSVRISQDGITHLTAPQPEETHRMVLKGPSLSKVSIFIQKSLTKVGAKVGGAIAEKLGAVVMKLVMKEVFGVDDDPDRIIKEVERIVKAEIEANEITRVMGTIDGTLSAISGEYYNKKLKLQSEGKLKDKAARVDLTNKIEGFSNRFYTDVVGLLRQEKYAEKGLKTFLFGATVHLMLTQELALVDPDEMDPNKSSYLITLRSNAANYKTHVQNVYNTAMAARNNFRVFSERTTVESGNRYRTITHWYWQDYYLNQRHGPYAGSKNPDKTGEQNAHEAMEQARAAALLEKRTQLGDPEASFLNVIDGVVNFEGFSDQALHTSTS